MFTILFCSCNMNIYILWTKTLIITVPQSFKTTRSSPIFSSVITPLQQIAVLLALAGLICFPQKRYPRLLLLHYLHEYREWIYSLVFILHLRWRCRKVVWVLDCARTDISRITLCFISLGVVGVRYFINYPCLHTHVVLQPGAASVAWETR